MAGFVDPVLEQAYWTSIIKIEEQRVSDLEKLSQEFSAAALRYAVNSKQKKDVQDKIDLLTNPYTWINKPIRNSIKLLKVNRISKGHLKDLLEIEYSIKTACRKIQDAKEMLEQ